MKQMGHVKAATRDDKSVVTHMQNATDAAFDPEKRMLSIASMHQLLDRLGLDHGQKLVVLSSVTMQVALEVCWQKSANDVVSQG